MNRLPFGLYLWLQSPVHDVIALVLLALYGARVLADAVRTVRFAWRVVGPWVQFTRWRLASARRLRRTVFSPVRCHHAPGEHADAGLVLAAPDPVPAVLSGDDWDGVLSDTPEPLVQPAGRAELGDAFDLIDVAWESGEFQGPLPHRDALHVPTHLLPDGCTDLFGGPPSKAQIERGIVELLVQTWREHERQFGGAS